MDSPQKKMLYLAAGSILVVALEFWMFPRLFGFNLLRVSWQYFAYEVVFYGFAAVALFGTRNLLSTLKVIATAFGYRMILSLVFAVLLTAIFSMDFAISIQLALFSYLPGAALQIALIPVICWPLLNGYKDQPRRTREMNYRDREPEIVSPAPRAPFPTSTLRERPAQAETVAPRHDNYHAEAQPMPIRTRTESNSVTVTGDLNGFERTVRYIAEHGSVLYAAVVDPEGLLLANSCRGRIVPEDMAPLAVMFFEWNKSVLDKGKLGPAEKIDITLKDKRLILGRVESWCLMVFSERQADDLLNIRINQGMDILRKYTAERNISGQQTQAEKAYV